MKDINPITLGSDEHLTLLMSVRGLNLVTGKDRADLLGFAKDVWSTAVAISDARLHTSLGMLLQAANAVTAWDWSGNDEECVADMRSLAEVAGDVERWLRHEEAMAWADSPAQPGGEGGIRTHVTTKS